MVPPSVPPERSIISGLRCRMRSIFFMRKALVVDAMTSITHCTCSERCTLGAFRRHGLYRASLPSSEARRQRCLWRHRCPRRHFPCAGVIIFSPSRIFRPESSSTSANVFKTPRVTLLKRRFYRGGRLPRKVWRYAPPFFFNQNGLGRGTATVCGNDNVQIIILFQCNGSPQMRKDRKVLKTIDDSLYSIF